MMYVGNWAAAAVARDGPCRSDLESDYLLAIDDLRHDHLKSCRVVFRGIARNTDQRTFVTALAPAWFPCGNSLSIVEPSSTDISLRIELAAYLSSLSFDWCVRQHMSGTNLNWHVVKSLGLPHPRATSHRLGCLYSNVALTGVQFPVEWLRISHIVQRPRPHMLSLQERLRIAASVDAVVALTMGLNVSDLRHILAECDRSQGAISGTQTKGFWRIDKDRNPELRHTILSLIAYYDLDSKIRDAGGDREKGIEAFLAQNNGEGWMLPETVCLADYSLGHDDRAQHPQPVASRLGPRFYDWQLIQSTDESWRECHLHARNLLGAPEYARVVSNAGDHASHNSLPLVADRRMTYGESKRGQKSLFAPETEA